MEKLLGVELPKGADVDFFRWQPSSELSFYEAYVRIAAPPDDLLSTARRLGLARAGEEGARGHLPASWRPKPGVELDWWDASGETPPESWAGPFGVGGRIVAKVEGGRLYAIVTETGRGEGVT